MPLSDESMRLLDDIHTTYCTRSAVASRHNTPQVWAHQVEGLVADRLTAIEAAARADADPLRARVALTSDMLDDALEACFGRENGQTLGTRLYQWVLANPDHWSLAQTPSPATDASEP